MISLLAKLLIKDRKNIRDLSVRRAYGVLCSITGIALNILLFAGKYVAGIVSGSIAVTADAFNNLSDAGSSMITLIGFKFAGKKADKDHPFGHGRIEYISGFIVSVLIIVMGFELGKSSVMKIISPEPVDAGLLTVVILASSICVKIYMGIYNRKIGKKINSSAMRAAAMDSFSDTVATSAVLISALVSRFTIYNIDGICGVLVSLLILYAGYNSAKDTLSPLMGQKPDPELIESIERIVMSHKSVAGMHDLVVHDYGPGRQMISLHAEVPSNGDIHEMHDTIDLIERELEEETGCVTVIHMDPISTDDETVNKMREFIVKQVKTIDEGIDVHDFRMVPGPTHTNLIFDAAVCPGFRLCDAELKTAIEAIVERNCENCFAVVRIDKLYI